MPRFSQTCPSCDWLDLDIILTSGEAHRCPLCNHITEHFYPIGSTSADVVSDEYVGGKNFKGTLSDKDLVFYSKSEQKAWMTANGWTHADEYTPLQDGGRNPRQTEWALPPPPGFDPRPMACLTTEEQAARHAEWLSTEPSK